MHIEEAVHERYGTIPDVGSQHEHLFQHSINTILNKPTTNLIAWNLSVDTAVEIEKHRKRREILVRQKVTKWFKPKKEIEALQQLINTLSHKFANISFKEITQPNIHTQTPSTINLPTE